MPSAEQLRSRLSKKLSELFQLDQPDLDFGFYRIMHAKAQEVQEFIDKDLLNIVAEAFGSVEESRKAELQAKIDKALQAAKEHGVSDPENSPKVKEARAAYAALKDTASAEADVYDHLYRFFERYYDDGDFISRRYYTRETPGKAAPFAVPYNGEEVKLHWANADQYYIKSAEYFSNFTFDLTQSGEVRKMSKEERELREIPFAPFKVHFKVVEATEGEHGDVKVAEANKRFFILHGDNPVELTEASELVVKFEYRPDPEKSGQDNAWREKRNAEAVKAILERLQDMAAAGGEHNERAAKYLNLFKVLAPTESDKKRTVLAKYINQYTARNTRDYFIHKDLGGFLRRELDFYIKNEVMRLDDIEEADAPAVESYLAKIKVLRRIAVKLIDFLAQLEEFQKKLWLKKKFVVETNYCVTLDRVPEELYPEIAENEAQIDEWVKLFAVDEIGKAGTREGGKQGLFGERAVAFSRPLAVEFLKANDKLVLDTRFFDESFKARLLASVENFDDQCDGLLIHSENFQALNLLQGRYREQVKCIYIDPPYNTGNDGFAYKDSYQHSSWLSLMIDRIADSLELIINKGCFLSSMDDNEIKNYHSVLDSLLSSENFVIDFIWKKRTNPPNDQYVGSIHEFVTLYAKNKKSMELNLLPRGERLDSSYTNPDNDERGPWKAGDLSAGNKGGRAAPSCIYEIVNPVSLERHFPPQGRRWVYNKEKMEQLLSENRIWFGLDNKGKPKYKRFLSDVRQGVAAPSILLENGTSHSAATELLNILGFEEFETPKPKELLSYLFAICNGNSSLILDYFAGSGTTGHAVINLNREDGGKRKYILVEMGDYFDTVLKPRIAKVVYSESWKDGKPVAINNGQSTMNKKTDGSLFNGVSHCMKYLRLESYEDTLNNLRLDQNSQRQKMLTANPALKEDYILRYQLDVETRGSQSLLNIDGFADPTAYTLDVKKPGTDEYATRPVDLIETFNYLIGLRVVHYDAPQEFTANFKRVEDPEVPTDQKTKLVLDGKLRQIKASHEDTKERSGEREKTGPGDSSVEMERGYGNSDVLKEEDIRGFVASCERPSPVWWFRKVEGWVPANPQTPNDGQREKVLIVWRKLTDDIERDNLMLDEWFTKMCINPRDFEFDTIYVNGSNNLPNLKLDNENWKVRLIEEEFMKRMWEAQ